MAEDPTAAAHAETSTHERLVCPAALSADELTNLCATYFDGEASGYDDFDRSVDKRRLYCEAVDSYIVDRLSAQRACDRLLSFGCGTGRREAAIAARLPTMPTIFGVEHSSAMAAVAARRGIRVFPSLDCVGIPQDASISVALCLSSFVHLPDVDSRTKTLRRLYELLVGQGVLVIDVFNINDRFEWGTALRSEPADPEYAGLARGDVLYRRVGHRDPSYMHYFSLGEIATLIEESGFVIEELTSVGYGQHSGRVGGPLNEGCLLLTCRKP